MTTFKAAVRKIGLHYIITSGHTAYKEDRERYRT